MSLNEQIITGKAKLAGVVGDPISHSLSPVIHNYWLRREHIDGAYLPLHVSSEDFASAIDTLHKIHFRGVNVTIPHKEHAFRLVDVHTLSAEITGSVNTIIFKNNGQILGASTDGSGFVASLEDEHVFLKKGMRVCMLGAGGAARSVAASLVQKNVSLTITNRHKERAQKLADFLKQRFDHIDVLDWHEWEEHLGDYDLLINTTSLGMVGGPHPSYCPSFTQVSEKLVVADCVYRPLLTPLLAQAQKRGCKIVKGLGMLIHQAAFGFKAWFGKKPTIDKATYDYVCSYL